MTQIHADCGNVIAITATISIAATVWPMLLVALMNRLQSGLHRLVQICDVSLKSFF